MTVWPCPLCQVSLASIAHPLVARTASARVFGCTESFVVVWGDGQVVAVEAPMVRDQARGPCLPRS